MARCGWAGQGSARYGGAVVFEKMKREQKTRASKIVRVFSCADPEIWPYLV